MTKPKKPEDKLKVGRKTAYKKEYCKLAYKLALLGLTDIEMAGVFEVSEQTFNNWKVKHPELFESIKEGKDIADVDVAVSLRQRALGYSHEDVDIRVVDGRIVKTKIIKHYPPDTAAAIFYLKNRQKLHWRDKQEIGVTDNDGNDVVLFRMPENNRD